MSSPVILCCHFDNSQVWVTKKMKLRSTSKKSFLNHRIYKAQKGLTMLHFYIIHEHFIRRRHPSQSSPLLVALYMFTQYAWSCQRKSQRLWNFLFDFRIHVLPCQNKVLSQDSHRHRKNRMLTTCSHSGHCNDVCVSNSVNVLTIYSKEL